MSRYDVSRHATIGELIQARQSQDGITDQEIAAELGHADDKLIGSIKSGVLCLPLTSVVDLAWILNVDEGAVLRLALFESDPSALSVIESIVGPIGVKRGTRKGGKKHAGKGGATEFAEYDPAYTGKPVMQLAREGLIRLAVCPPDDVDAKDSGRRRRHRISTGNEIPADVASLDQLGDPLRVSTAETMIVHAYRSACNGNPETATLTLPNAIVLVVPSQMPPED